MGYGGEQQYRYSGGNRVIDLGGWENWLTQGDEAENKRGYKAISMWSERFSEILLPRRVHSHREEDICLDITSSVANSVGKFRSTQRSELRYRFHSAEIMLWIYEKIDRVTDFDHRVNLNQQIDSINQFIDSASPWESRSSKSLW